MDNKERKPVGIARFIGRLLRLGFGSWDGLGMLEAVCTRGAEAAER